MYSFDELHIHSILDDYYLDLLVVGMLIILCFDHQCSGIKIQYIHIHLALHMLAGILTPPQQIGMNISNNTVTLSWVAPDSLQVSTPTISHYVLNNNLINGTKKFNNPTTCNPVTSCNYSLI